MEAFRIPDNEGGVLCIWRLLFLLSLCFPFLTHHLVPALVSACVPALFSFGLLVPLVDYSVPKNIGLCPCLCSACRAISARVRYSTALPHLLLFVIFLISHVYYICYFLLTMYGHKGNAGILSHVISCQLRKTVISFLYPIMFKKSIL